MQITIFETDKKTSEEYKRYLYEFDEYILTHRAFRDVTNIKIEVDDDKKDIETAIKFLSNYVKTL